MTRNLTRRKAVKKRMTSTLEKAKAMAAMVKAMVMVLRETTTKKTMMLTRHPWLLPPSGLP
jgi:hypothetical protein